MKKFLKVSEINLVNGGYLVTKEGEIPVSNQAFVAAQKPAEYIVTFAKLAKDKDFKGKKADSLESLKAAVAAELSAKAKTYVSKPAEVKRKIGDQLAAEALSFIAYGKESSKVEKINEFLQQFNVLSEFEEFGLFFEEDIVKLNKLYTMEEVTEAVKSTINLLD